MTAYYNEIDPFAAQWLRNLINAGHIAPGDVDERDIRDVRPGDLALYNQCHFFAGVGVWSYALRSAGVSDHANVWTGSCPCQPFSQAGAGAGFDDERHLWPYFHWLISQCRPAKVFGEQVASKDGLGWIDLVQTDLEGTDYAFGAADMCAAGFGAPHIRQRLYWVADAAGTGCVRRRTSETSDERGSSRIEFERLCNVGGLADDDRLGLDALSRDGRGTLRIEGAPAPAHGVSGELGHADGSAESIKSECAISCHEKRSTIELWPDLGPTSRDSSRDHTKGSCSRGSGSSIQHGYYLGGSSPTNGFWRDADWLLCRDGKWRPVEPGAFPLAHGAAKRVGRLRGYGNAIVAPQAIAFIEACCEEIDIAAASAPTLQPPAAPVLAPLPY